MRSLRQKILAGALGAWIALAGCSKNAETPPPASVEASPPPAVAAPAAAPVAPAAVANVQQMNATWDVVSKQIQNQDYDNAVRQAIQLNKAQQQAQLSEAARLEYQRRLYDAQEALRQKAQTDPKAREAYEALGRAVMGR